MRCNDASSSNLPKAVEPSSFGIGHSSEMLCMNATSTVTF
jgi:hypothetical protein